MRSIITTIILGALLLAAPALAQESRVVNLGTLIDGVALNAGAGLTATLGPQVVDADKGGKQVLASFKYLVLCTDYTFANGGTLSHTVTVGPTVAGAKFSPGVCDSADGTCTSNGGGLINIVVSADTDRCHRMNIRGFPAVKIVNAHSAAGANDLLTLTGWVTD